MHRLVVEGTTDQYQVSDEARRIQDNANSN